MFIPKTLLGSLSLLALAIAVATPEHAQRQLTIPSISPESIFTVDAATSTANCARSGLVDKSHTDGGHELSTMVFYTYLLTSIVDRPGSRLWGSRQLNVYTLNTRPMTCSVWWTPGTGRNISLGRIEVDGSRPAARWLYHSSSYLTYASPCAPAGTVEGLEFVPVSEYDHVEWTQGQGYGVQIAYYL
ncbi:hypothetical protein B0T22DRAFT_521120 [Podospora appendiculata]|uniref:Ubiquitin 3 binding protein But2 C-terminal domain-containing protein n=1 Tax=Podospora appendiculata TaxID=314037 RepID=A0AAE0X086_9PEZI|nr:hypothetical protein B0T22DRAFT_521120 [Podospora appendiculata]